MCTFSAAGFTSPLLPLGLLLGLAVLGLLRWLIAQGWSRRVLSTVPTAFQPSSGESAAIEVLRERFARGEIDAGAFERQLTGLLEQTRRPE